MKDAPYAIDLTEKIASAIAVRVVELLKIEGLVPTSAPIRWLTVEQVMDRTQLSRSTVYALMASGDLESVEGLGRSKRIPESALRDWSHLRRKAS
jgi:excisionase family DNA binding protein